MAFEPVVDLSTLNGSTGFRLDGIDTGDGSGFSVAGAGDVNGDGIDDLIIGARDANGGRGESYVVFGRDSTAPNTDPVARDDALMAERGQIIALDPLADNGFGADSDPDAGDVLSVSGLAAEARGRAFLAADGTVFYRSAPGADAANSFDYILSDGRGGTDTGTVTVALSEPQGSGLSIGEAQRVALLFEAGLNCNGNISESGLNFHMDALEAGLSERALARQFINSNEFETKYGDPETLSDREFVELLFLNTLDRPGGAEGIAFWTDYAGRDGVEDEDLLILFANSFENIVNSAQVLTLEQTSPGDWTFG